MKIKGVNRFLKVTQQFTSRFDRKALILMYHRVAEVGSDPWALCVTPQHFAEQLEVLQEHIRPVRLQQLSGALRNGDIPRRSVVLTFDDGYADNLHNARPLLERYDMPATVFIATGHLEHGGAFWWDELESLLLQPGTLPEELQLNINGARHQWELGEAVHYSEATYRRYRGWRAWEDAPTSRHCLYYFLWQLLQPLPESERRGVMDELRTWARVVSKDRAARLSLSPEQLITLARGRLVEIGSHTVTHPVLSALPVVSQQDEIEQSKASLENILNRPVTSFAYPYGARCNYTDETIAIVQGAGFTCACATLSGPVKRGADCFQLPRVQVQDWDGEQFARRLAAWFDGAAVATEG